MKMAQDMNHTRRKKPTKETVKVIKFGLMVLFTRDTGKMIKLTAEEDLSTLMVMFMKETGRMTKLTEKENIYTQTALNTKASGKKINNTAKESAPRHNTTLTFAGKFEDMMALSVILTGVREKRQK